MMTRKSAARSNALASTTSEQLKPASDFVVKGETHWRERPLTSLQVARELSGVSVASLYRFAAEGTLKLRRLAGRTLVETPSLIALIEQSEGWTASTRTEKAKAARIERARAAWRD